MSEEIALKVVTTSEWDDSKTWSGLPAPDYWLIVERRLDGLM